MRGENLLLVVVCAVAVGGAGAMAWRWRGLPVVAPRVSDVCSARESALDAARTLVCVLTAGFVAGSLVVGCGGRLVMRILAATSGDGAQGRLTEAGEVVGNISFGGSVSFLIFAGIILPLAAAVMFIPVRRILPRSAWVVGLAYGLILLALFGVDDPLAPENIDFRILTPLWLAVTLITATALLFGLTLAAITARLDARLPNPPQRWSAMPWRHRAAYASLLLLVFPLFAVLAGFYIVIRAVSHGRLRPVLETAPARWIGGTMAVIATIAASSIVIGAALDIL